MTKRKIHLNFVDQTTILKRVQKEKRFAVLVSMGSKTYYFSNKQHAERFVKKFSNYVTNTYEFYLEIHSDILKTFNTLFAYVPGHIIYKIRNANDSIYKVLDMAFSEFAIRDNTTLINWLFWLENNLVMMCKELRFVARKTRNQSEYNRVNFILHTLQLHSDSFFNKYKNFEYRGQKDSSECETINLYNPLQLVINF